MEPVLARHLGARDAGAPIPGGRPNNTTAVATAPRVRRAQHLLESTHEPVKQVASLSGLGSDANLRQHFTRIVAVPPTNYPVHSDGDRTRRAGHQPSAHCQIGPSHQGADTDSGATRPPAGAGRADWMICVQLSAPMARPSVARIRRSARTCHRRAGDTGDAELPGKWSSGFGSRGTWVLHGGRPTQPARGLCEPTETPQRRDTVPDLPGIPRTKRHTPVHLLCVLKVRKTAGQQR
jgi:hypothetical protein